MNTELMFSRDFSQHSEVNLLLDISIKHQVPVKLENAKKIMEDRDEAGNI